MKNSYKIKISGLFIGGLLMLLGFSYQPAYSGTVVCPDSSIICNVSYGDVTVESEKGRDRGAIEFE